MADNTKIEWTDATWNPITGCSVVSPGCTNCYAMKLAGTRLQHHPSRAGLTKDSKAGPVWTGEVRFNEQWLTEPLKWKRPRMIFVCAHGDLFAEGVPDEWIDQVFAVMALAPHHTFQVLTKRPERMREYLTRPRWRPVLDFGQDERPSYWIAEAASKLWSRLPSQKITVPAHVRTFGEAAQFQRDLKNETLWPLPNVWLGVSVEDQPRANQRISILLETPAAIRWISAEPLLGGLDLTDMCQGNWFFDALRGTRWHDVPEFTSRVEQFARGLDWVVVGGESGRNARPMHPDWARSLRDQCAAAGVPFLFKQWGEYGPAFTGPNLQPTGLPWSGTDQIAVARGTATTLQACRRLGKKAAGRLLDGVEHNGFPVGRAA
ncbi:phage Gp37/Gp68 family protein [Agrobacterium vitis]|uniref:DUF5131 family protein n=1 Tax=Agrobacterium vitis TaxID=373 RepID=UPI001574A5B8|nr:phage Gp37/Gp68 family protein [Agrobacterium vitis]NSZ47957.1 phage Gp37/Gp68 family protein [Agrobacterium vitis]UJL72885.1 phage Gp37/Gp68 family protein [Agrobacterium vitis]